MSVSVQHDKNPETLLQKLSNSGVEEIELKGDSFVRAFAINKPLASEYNIERRTILMPVSSEAGGIVGKTGCVEILGHRPDEIDDSQVVGAPLSVSHDFKNKDTQIGTIERFFIGEDQRGWSEFQFLKTELATKIFNDIIKGKRPNVSIGGRQVRCRVIERNSDGTPSKIRITKWRPTHVMSVGNHTIPADDTVGFGRTEDSATSATAPETKVEDNAIVDGEQQSAKEETVERAATEPETTDPVSTEHKECDCNCKKKDPAPLERENIIKGDETMEEDKVTEPVVEKEVDIQAIISREMSDYKARGAKILAACQKNDAMDIYAKALADDWTVERTVTEILEGKLIPQGRAKKVEVSPDIGMSAKETKEYSIDRIFKAMYNEKEEGMRADKAWDKAGAGLEREASTAHRQKAVTEGHLEIHGDYSIPHDVLIARTLLQVKDQASAGLLVPTTTSQSIIELLTNSMEVLNLGARQLTGLVGNLVLPGKSGRGTSYQIGEGEDSTESMFTLRSVGLSPKTQTASMGYTREMYMQSSPNVEPIVRADLTETLALNFDLQAINGSGLNGNARGILNTTGIGSVVGGTNGAAPDWDDAVDLTTALADNNARLANLAYFTNTRVRGKWQKTLEASSAGSERIWQNSQGQGVVNGIVNGIRAVASNQVPYNLTKGSSSGVCSAIIFANWSDLILAFWGGIDVRMDKSTYAASDGTVIRLFQDYDVALRHVESFAAMLDALTT